MTTTYTFGKKNNSFNTFSINNKPNYSKILDNIILADIIDKNNYLFKTKSTGDYLDDLLINANPTKEINNDFLKATKFLANYKKGKKLYTLPFKLETLYKLSDGTPIIFYDDEIQIGSDFYTYANFANTSFINALTPSKKKIIIDIYTKAGTDIDINIL